MNPVSETPAAIDFRRFRVLPHRRELLADDRLVELGGRAFDLLMTLIEARGAVVSKDTLMERVWPGRIVEENNLQAQIAALRRVFAPERDLIRTIAGRGYQFTGEIRRDSARPSTQATALRPQQASASRLRQTNLGESVSELIGREVELDEIQDLSASHRLLTLTGVGGIGKTRLGFEVARHLLTRFADGVWAIELAPLTDPKLVPVTVATALGLELTAGVASPLSVSNALRSKQLMLMLDNCEHLVDAAAEMAETLLHVNPAARVIATSREPLRAEGEWVYQVLPLAVPAEDCPDSENPLRYGAVRLFAERASAAASYFSSDASAAAAMAPICRRLDGIPLAIELAAARAAALGLEELSARLDDCFQLLEGGRRTALPRHQTLRATLDWSYELLTEAERLLLRRLAIFPGGFTWEAASAVAADAALPERDAIDCLSGLVAKSLVSIMTIDATRYRLLETTRAYASGKLADSGESESLAKRHAAFFLELFERETAWEVAPAATGARLAPDIDNLRGALEWTLRPAGDVATGVALAAAAVPLWTQLSLLGECRIWVVRALEALDRMAAPDRRREMLLQAALANAVLGTVGTVDAVGVAWNRALALAEELGDIDQKLRALYGLYLYQMRIGDFRSGLAFARGFRTAAEQKSEPSDLLMGDRIVGVSMFWLGDPGGARAQIERMLSRSSTVRSRLQAIRFGVDQRVAGLFHLSRILWVQGFPDQAVRTAVAGVDEAGAIEHTASLCFALADGACPVSAWFGDTAATARFASMLSERAEKLGLGIWHAYSLAWRGWLADRQGESQTAVNLFNAAITDFRATQFDLHFTTFLSIFAEILARAGRVEDGAAAIGEAVERAERTEERWCFPELLRIQGDITWRLGGSGSAQLAEHLYVQALEWARRQSSPSWELRIAMSFARLRQQQGRDPEARELVKPVYDRFTEGFGSADLIAARALLADLT